MSRSGNSLWGGLFFWWVIGLWLHDWLNNVPSVIFWIAYGATVVCGGYALALGGRMIENVRERNRKRSEAGLACKHGIKGGETRDLCATCKAERIQREKEYEIEHLQRERRKQLELAAAKLRTEEHVRLTKARMHKLEFLMSLSPAQFEDAVAMMYRQLGYVVSQTAISNDFGRDAIISRDGNKYLVECKRYAADMPIGRPSLQKFYAAMVGDKADGGFFVTTSSFAHTAVNYAQDTNITCIDGRALSVLMLQAYPNDGDSSYTILCCECGQNVTFDLNKSEHERLCPNGHTIVNDLDTELMSPSLVAGVPTCSKCGKKMRIVLGRRGKFWGCSAYPRCRSIRPYRGLEQVAAAH
jgi:hypothetical protein